MKKIFLFFLFLISFTLPVCASSLDSTYSDPYIDEVFDFTSTLLSEHYLPFHLVDASSSSGSIFVPSSDAGFRLSFHNANVHLKTSVSGKRFYFSVFYLSSLSTSQLLPTVTIGDAVLIPARRNDYVSNIERVGSLRYNLIYYYVDIPFSLSYSPFLTISIDSSNYSVFNETLSGPYNEVYECCSFKLAHCSFSDPTEDSNGFFELGLSHVSFPYLDSSQPIKITPQSSSDFFCSTLFSSDVKGCFIILADSGISSPSLRVGSHLYDSYKVLSPSNLPSGKSLYYFYDIPLNEPGLFYFSGPPISLHPDAYLYYANFYDVSLTPYLQDIDFDINQLLSFLRASSAQQQLIDQYNDQISTMKSEGDDLLSRSSIVYPSIEFSDFSSDNLIDSGDLLLATSSISSLLSNSLVIKMMLICVTISVISYFIFGKKS